MILQDCPICGGEVSVPCGDNIGQCRFCGFMLTETNLKRLEEFKNRILKKEIERTKPIVELLLHLIGFVELCAEQSEKHNDYMSALGMWDYIIQYKKTLANYEEGK